MSAREDYLKALQAERGKIAQRPQSAANDERLAHIDEVIDRHAEHPVRRRIESAVRKAKP